MATKRDSFSALRAKLAKKYDTAIGSLGDVAKPVEAISTGNLAIDHILGVGGFPKGRCIELYGPPSCGKTTLALQSAAEFQSRAKAGEVGYAGRVVLYMDHENAMDPVYARALGLDTEDETTFLFAQPSSLEDSANISRELVATGQVGLVIFDSVAAMTPQAALEAETGKASVAIQARLMSDFLKAFIEELYATDTTAIFLNHIAEVIDMGGRPGVKRYTTPGGRALKFYASLRMEFQQIKNVTREIHDDLTNEKVKQVEATDVRVKVVKNKTAPPFKQAVVRVRYGKGFDQGYSALRVLAGYKAIREATGGYYVFDKVPSLWDGMSVNPKGQHVIRGLHNVLDKADKDAVWNKELVRLAQEMLANPPSSTTDDEEATDIPVSEGEDDLTDTEEG